MSRPDARAFSGTVTGREVLGDHLVRITVDVPGFSSTGVPDEWVALTVPGQFQTRYYTVRSCSGTRIVLDVVIHDEGLVTRWAQTDCVGDVVGISEPKGSFDLPADATWVVLVGDLTGLPTGRGRDHRDGPGLGPPPRRGGRRDRRRRTRTGEACADSSLADRRGRG